MPGAKDGFSVRDQLTQFDGSVSVSDVYGLDNLTPKVSLEGTLISTSPGSPQRTGNKSSRHKSDKVDTADQLLRGCASVGGMFDSLSPGVQESAGFTSLSRSQTATASDVGDRLMVPGTDSSYAKTVAGHFLPSEEGILRLDKHKDGRRDRWIKSSPINGEAICGDCLRLPKITARLELYTIAPQTETKRWILVEAIQAVQFAQDQCAFGSWAACHPCGKEWYGDDFHDEVSWRCLVDHDINEEYKEWRSSIRAAE